MSQLYPVSVVAIFTEWLNAYTYHHHIKHVAFHVLADSYDEATGKGMRIALQLYPKKDKWKDHHVTVASPTCVVDPDGPITAFDTPVKIRSAEVNHDVL